MNKLRLVSSDEEVVYWGRRRTKLRAIVDLGPASSGFVDNYVSKEISQEKKTDTKKKKTTKTVDTIAKVMLAIG